ncbi:MAG: hypothetical protein AAFY10_08950 [Pseudomonadota bacterium]
MTLFETFSLHQKLPITIDSIIETLLEKGYVQHNLLHEVFQEEIVISGMLIRRQKCVAYTSNNGFVDVADIVYEGGLSDEGQRLVLAKELLHICDSEEATSRTDATVNDLTRELTLPTELLAELVHMRPETHADNLGLVRAVAILFPKECRDELKPAFDEGRLPIEIIHKMVDIPLPFIELVMSDQWDAIYETLAEQEKALSCAPPTPAP